MFRELLGVFGGHLKFFVLWVGGNVSAGAKLEENLREMLSLVYSDQRTVS